MPTSTSRRPARRRVFALALVLAFLAGLLVFASSSSATDYYDLQKALRAAQAEQKRLDAELADVAAQKKQLQKQNAQLQGNLAWLNTRSAEEKQTYERLLGELDAALQELDQALADFADAQKTLEDKQKQYRSRLQVMFESRTREPLEVLLDAKDAAGFFANLEVIAAVAENDRRIVDELRTAKDDAILKMKTAQENTTKMRNVVNDKWLEIDALKNKMALTQDQIATTQKHLEEVLESENQLLEESERIATNIVKLQEKIAYYGGIFVWPYADQKTVDQQTIASPFGMRMHPILHVYKMHTGVDIGGRYGAPIVAAAKGKVLVVSTIPGYNPTTGNNTGGTGYGNYIVIDHGGGISTLYAHTKLIKVKVGQVVNAGELIALCGSTGTSTGPHLHFEVRENGTPVNPMQTKYLGVR
jgi:murein DD-endopeptidase MepM/ murein hydrolase activator NlpD